MQCSYKHAQKPRPITDNEFKNSSTAGYGFLPSRCYAGDVTDLVFVVNAVERVEMRIAGRPTDTAAVGFLVVLAVPSSVGTDTVHTAENLIRMLYNTKN